MPVLHLPSWPTVDPPTAMADHRDAELERQMFFCDLFKQPMGKSGTRTPTTRAPSPIEPSPRSDDESCSSAQIAQANKIDDFICGIRRKLDEQSNKGRLQDKHAQLQDKQVLSDELSNTFIEPRPLALIVADIRRGFERADFGARPATTGTCRAAPSNGTLAVGPSPPGLLRSHSSSSSLAGSPSRSLRRADSSVGGPGQRPATANVSASRQLVLRRANSMPQRQQAQRRPGCKGRINAAHMDALMDLFGSFASGRVAMYWKDFEELLRSKMLFDSQFMVLDARRIFNSALLEGKRSVDFGAFLDLFREVAFERRCQMDTLCEMLLVM